jgi:hypothetical protein
MERGGHTSREFVDWLAAARGTVDLMGRALGLPRAIPPLSWLGISSDGLVVTLDTATGENSDGSSYMSFTELGSRWVRVTLGEHGHWRPQRNARRSH